MQSTTRQPQVGPIQLVMIGYPPDAEFRGETLRALSNLRGRGVIRLIDALFVRKDDQGRVTTSMRRSDMTLHERESLGAIVGGLLGLAAGGDEESEALGATYVAHKIADDAFGFGLGDLQKVREKIGPGQAALLLLIEHQWALELKAAVRNSGGVPLTQGFLTPEALVLVGAEVKAVADAEDAIALAQAIEGAAVLAALASVEASDMARHAAVAETARVLIAAGLIDAAATQEVIDTLLAADLIQQEALIEARASAERANQEVAAVKAAQVETDGKAPVGAVVGSEE